MNKDFPNKMRKQFFLSTLIRTFAIGNDYIFPTQLINTKHNK